MKPTAQIKPAKPYLAPTNRGGFRPVLFNLNFKTDASRIKNHRQTP